MADRQLSSIGNDVIVACLTALSDPGIGYTERARCRGVIQALCTDIQILKQQVRIQSMAQQIHHVHLKNGGKVIINMDTGQTDVCLPNPIRVTRMMTWTKGLNPREEVERLRYDDPVKAALIEAFTVVPMTVVVERDD